MNYAILARGPERYILIFTDEQRSEALRTLGRWASDPGLAFDWEDAAKVSREIREESCQGK